MRRLRPVLQARAEGEEPGRPDGKGLCGACEYNQRSAKIYKSKSEARKRHKRQRPVSAPTGRRKQVESTRQAVVALGSSTADARMQLMQAESLAEVGNLRSAALLAQEAVAKAKTVLHDPGLHPRPARAGDGGRSVSPGSALATTAALGSVLGLPVEAVRASSGTVLKPRQLELLARMNASAGTRQKRMGRSVEPPPVRLKTSEQRDLDAEVTKVRDSALSLVEEGQMFAKALERRRVLESDMQREHEVFASTAAASAARRAPAFLEETRIPGSEVEMSQRAAAIEMGLRP